MTTLFRGGEDIDFAQIGGSYGLTNAANIWLNTTAGGQAFRTDYARCAISPGGGQLGGSSITASNANWIRSRQFTGTDFWLTARLSQRGNDSVGAHMAPGQNGLLALRDAGLVARLRLYPQPASNNITIAGPYQLQKLTAAGVATTLATSTSGFSETPSSPDKLDIHVNYAVSGSCQIYINETLVLNFTGDLTTDGQTALAFAEFGSPMILGNSSTQLNWSEVIVSTRDTRNQSLVIRAPVAAGHTDQWTGVAGDMNDIIANDANPNVSDTAAQIQQYTLGSLPAGSFAILDVTQTVRATLGATGPQHLQLGNRLTSDHFSTDLTPTIAWDTYSYTTTVNPESGVAYTTADLNAIGYNVAMKSTA